ncbi:MAG: signal peptidase II [Halanaerobiales bacterium]|nr:signal peptidase II [Halanaerobiales bacterium]
MCYFIMLMVTFCDQLIKALIRSNFLLYQSIPLVSDVFHLTYVQNTGAGFGILAGRQNFFIIIAGLIITGLLIYKYQAADNRLLDLALGLIIGGALGNVIDRIFLGYVVDYLDFRIWPVFNLADAMIVIGSGIFIFYFWKVEQSA